MREAQLILEGVSYRTDELQQQIPCEPEKRTVLTRVKNVSRTEWTDAARQGMKAQWCVTVWADEYKGEEKAILDGTPYSIYRTYWDGGDRMELYLGKKVGV